MLLDTRKILGLVLVALLTCWSANAQEDTTTKASDDSLQNELLQANTKYLQHLDSIKRDDSVKRAQLEEELKSLKTTDNLKKEELQSQLQKIKDEENSRILQQKQRIDSLKQVVKGFPVVPFTDTLFYVYAKLGPFTAQARAGNIVNKVKKLEEDILFHRDSLKVFVSEQTVDLLYKDVIVLSVTDVDAMWMGVSKEQLTERYKEKIVDAIKSYREATSLQTLLKEIGLALLVIILVYIFIKYLNKGYRWLRVKVFKLRGKLINGIRIRNYELFTAQTEVNAIFILLNILRWVIILLTIYLMLPVLFWIFPWTKNLAGTLFGYVLKPLKSILWSIWNYLPNLVTIIVIVFIFRYVFKALRFLRDEVKSGALQLPGFYSDWATPTYQIIRILIFAFMVIVIFPYLPGSDSPIFRGVSVFLGVLFTFGSSGSLSNIVSGLILTYMRAFKVGDRVMIGTVTGDIIEKTLLVTRIRTIKNEEITIPNSTIMSNHTINYSAAAQSLGLIVHTTVTIGYDVPWKTVHELLISAATETDMIVEHPTPFVLQTSLDDFYVSYQINAYTREPSKQALIYSSLHQHIQDKFNEAGVEIMSPHYNAMRDGNQTTIPNDYLPEDYVAPSFRMRNTDNDSKKQ